MRIIMGLHSCRLFFNFWKAEAHQNIGIMKEFKIGTCRIINFA